MEKKAYQAVIKAQTGLLLGGTVSHTSSPFEQFKDAVSWSDTAVQINKDANRDVIHDGIYMVTCPTERVIRSVNN